MVEKNNTLIMNFKHKIQLSWETKKQRQNKEKMRKMNYQSIKNETLDYKCLKHIESCQILIHFQELLLKTCPNHTSI